MDDPIQIYQQYLEKEAQINKTNRNKLASLKKEQKSKKERYSNENLIEDTVVINNTNVTASQIPNINLGEKGDIEEKQIDQRILKRTIIF
jgi:hypothetical protein